MVRTQEVSTALLLRPQVLVCDNVEGSLFPDDPKKGTAFICQGLQVQRNSSFLSSLLFFIFNCEESDRKFFAFFCI